MPKTGTTSLHAALEFLGFRSRHFAADVRTLEQLKNGDYRLDIMRQLDALSDIPAPAIFAQLDQVWPDALFILTTREMNSWIESCRLAKFNSPVQYAAPGSLREFYRTQLYGTVAFNEERFRWVHERHLRDVALYFRGERAARLLTLDLTAGAGWEPLCHFVGKPIPKVPFPHANKRQ